MRGLNPVHWMSVKTQPLPAFVRWWVREGRPVEVVSELELEIALRCGCPPHRILVNGPAKHRWLHRHALHGLAVNFDSVAEVDALSRLAARCRWRCGMRVNTRGEFDPESPSIPTQFGLGPSALREAVRRARRAGLRPEILHFHLRTQLPDAGIIDDAIAHALAMARDAGVVPTVLDIGGGLPAPCVRRAGGERADAEFSTTALRGILKRHLTACPSIRELWLENGRRLLAGTGVLVVRVLDVKEQRGMRHLICDGGRTLHAMVATWEEHNLMLFPARSGPATPTTVVGPTCMAFDKLARRPLPRSVRVGDAVAWMDAGAYHLPWETRFSHGLPAVWWHDGGFARLVRPPETPDQWWCQWKTPGPTP